MRLTDPLPLRQTTEWAEYQTIEPLPLRFGRDVWGACIPYSQDLTQWVWAGHASQAISEDVGPIDTVTVDGVEVSGFTSRNVTDSAGLPVTMVILSEPLDPGRIVHARGRGAADAANGALIENPADVLLYLARLHGASLTRSQLTQLEQESTARGLRLSTSVTATDSLGAIVSQLAEQLCGVWSPSLPGWLRLLPLASAHAPLISVEDPDLTELRASRTGRAQQITARYGYRLGEPTKTIVVRDRGAIDPVNITVDLTALADGRAVLDVATRLLQRYALAPVNISAQLRGLAPPGTPVALQSQGLQLTATAAVIAARYDASSDRTSADLEAQLSARTINADVISTTEQVAGLTREILSGPASPLDPITVRGPNGPLAGARVTLDGTITRVTDSDGRVTFPRELLTPGVHTFVARLDGYADQVWEMTF